MERTACYNLIAAAKRFCFIFDPTMYTSRTCSRAHCKGTTMHPTYTDNPRNVDKIRVFSTPPFSGMLGLYSNSNKLRLFKPSHAFPLGLYISLSSYSPIEAGVTYGPFDPWNAIALESAPC